MSQEGGDKHVDKPGKREEKRGQNRPMGVSCGMPAPPPKAAFPQESRKWTDHCHWEGR